MANISVQISDELHKKLVRKAHEIGDLKLSDTIRILLKMALEIPNPFSGAKPKNKELQYLITTYHLVNEFVSSLEDKGTKINNAAHKKAEKVLAELGK